MESILCNRLSEDYLRLISIFIFQIVAYYIQQLYTIIRQFSSNPTIYIRIYFYYIIKINSKYIIKINSNPTIYIRIYFYYIFRQY